MSSDSPTATGAISDLDIARAWHRLSDHGRAGAAFDGPACTCSRHALRVRQLLNWVIDNPATEPSGLGAVVANPITGSIWVRAAHPHLPWKGTDQAPQEWADPTAERWFAWDDLPRPLELKAPGWQPPADGAAGQDFQTAGTDS